MKKFLVIGVIAALLAVIGWAAFGPATASAQGPMPGVGRGQALGGPQNSLVAVAAKLFGMDAQTLLQQLYSGKTIADVAKEKNVSTDKIVDEFLATRKDALKTAVDNKRLTQAQADAELALMKANAQAELTRTFNPPAFNPRRGPGMMGPGFQNGRGPGMMGPGFQGGQPQGRPFQRNWR